MEKGPLQSGITVSLDQAVFAAAIMAIGACGLIAADFIAAWQPVPHNLPARETLAYLCAVGCLAAGGGLLWRRGAAIASCVLIAAFLLWMIVFRLPAIMRAPAAAVSYESWGECAVMVAASWMIFARCADHRSRQWIRLATGERGVRIAHMLLGLALIAFGVAHCAYVRETAALVPSWLPAHVAWVYFTAVTYIAAGAAVLAGVAVKPATALSAWQMGLFTALIWVPAVAANHAGISQWSELLDSWALAAGAWVVAASPRGASRIR